MLRNEDRPYKLVYIRPCAGMKDVVLLARGFGALRVEVAMYAQVALVVRCARVDQVATEDDDLVRF